MDEKQDRRDAKKAKEAKFRTDNRRSVRIIALLSVRPPKRRRK